MKGGAHCGTRRGIPSNEAGILDRVRFENSAAYLASWIAKLENDPRMIVSAASQAQRSTDFIMGIEQKESVESQLSPEGMPLTWARENGIDTRIPGFAHRDNDDDGVSNLIEWKHGTKPTTGFRCHANKECRYEFLEFIR